ncbi:MAG: protein-glutamate methylesterase/protein-glutamine glutaminase [Thermodesulfovibrio sp.]|uniref:Protein-glutamate methylesterase/protein-glutamine glutaminase n=1 Tax=Thermodesulfovibrio aggregans TaxID=86166 RepID=A0A2J6WPI4_9BACT|nr:MAG: chemotaxis response regulator protein-glutamate methylesterase [Thermodesulfovibrio aggregans]
MIKVLVVDDSAFMRKAITAMLQEDPEIKVIGTARDGVEAVQMVQELKPDIVTLDVEMPRMDGITALKEIMQKCPVPVIMVSSLTTEGAKVTLEALELGAVDFIPKNLAELSVNIIKIKGMLIDKIKTIGKRGLVKRKPVIKPAEPKIEVPKVEIPKTRITTERKVGIVSIGTSTGGPKALQEIIPKLPKDFPVPVVIAQHMPPNFTKPFAERLDQLSQLSVKEAEEGEPIKPGVVYVAPGRGHMRIKRRGIETFVSISEDREEFIYRPSVDVLMMSVAESYPGRTLGVILTGMGNDGAKGCRKIKETGGRVFAQNEESCVVYGMPRAVVEAGLADKVVSLEEMAGEIINAV